MDTLAYPKGNAGSNSMRELRVPRGMRKNAGQFIGIHFVLPHTVSPIMIVPRSTCAYGPL